MQRTLPVLLVLLTCFGLYRIFFSDSATDIRNQNPASATIICFGDSLTFGTGASPGKSYPEVLEKLIARPVINAGIPGDTTKTARARLQKDVLQRKPGIVIITLGGNDLKNGVSRETAFATLKEIITAIQDHGALVVVGGLKFFPLDRGYGSGYREVTEETGAVLVPDILDDIFNRPELMSDRIHPNDQGYAIMADRFADALSPFLDNISN